MEYDTITPDLREKVVSLYVDPSFPGAFSGSVTFTQLLHTDAGINLKYKDVLKILHSIPTFVQSAKRRYKFPRRSYNIQGFGELMQADLGFLNESNGYIGFLICVDVFSYKIWGRMLKQKTADAVLNAFKSIYEEVNEPLPENLEKIPYSMQFDSGTEFLNKHFLSFLKAQGIWHSTKHGNLKAGVAEYSIFRLKRKLSMYMREKLTTRWDKYFSKAIESLNLSPNKHIGKLLYF